jgi:hypothetical protein
MNKEKLGQAHCDGIRTAVCHAFCANDEISPGHGYAGPLPAASPAVPGRW